MKIDTTFLTRGCHMAREYGNGEDIRQSTSLQCWEEFPPPSKVWTGTFPLSLLS